MVMRIYLVVYFALVLAAAAALWQGGVLARLPVEWVGLAIVVALGLGVLLAAISLRGSRRPHTPA
jgi:hypothetical protein